MPISVGEVNATLRFTIQQEDIKAAQANLKDLAEKFRDAGGEATAAGQAILASMVPAQANLDALRTSAAATKEELKSIGQAGGENAIAAQVAAGTNEMTKFEGVATRMLERLATLYALREAFGFVQGLAVAADAMVHLADETGNSVQVLEEWTEMGEKAELPTNMVATAVQNLQKNLAEMKAGTGDALHDIGLDFQTIFAMSPDDRLNAIAKGLESVASPAERAKDEIALFGMDGIDPLIKRYAELQAASKNIIPPDAEQTLAGAVKGYKDLADQVKTFGAEVYATSIQGTAFIATPFFAFLTGGVAGLKAAVQDMGYFAGSVKQVQQTMDAPPGPLLGQAFINSLKTAITLTADQVTKLDELRAMGELNIANAVRAADVTTDQYKKYVDDVNAAKKTQEELLQVEKKVDDFRNQEEKKTIDEIAKLKAQYDAEDIARTGTTTDVEIANINKKYEDLIAQLTRTGSYNDAVAKQVQTDWQQALDGVGVDWKALQTNSVDELTAIYDKAQATFEAMTEDGRIHSQSQIQYFRNLRDEALKNLHDVQEAYDATTTAADKAAAQTERIAAATQKAADAAAAAAKAAQTLADMGGSTDVNRGNLAQEAAYWGIPAGIAFAAAEQGFSFTEIVEAYQSGTLNSWKPSGPRIQGFAEGGTVDIMTGEHGPEVARVPLGTTIYPTGTMPGPASLGGGGGPVNLVFNVNGNAVESARQIKKILMTDLGLTRQLGSAS